mmetsp:Transcript_15387/g.38078  ORF Transcript_15387/g.38078 Transcript_15387/m.38078 type:complete len:246 (+) Transcript_15387:85-822(+)
MTKLALALSLLALLTTAYASTCDCDCEVMERRSVAFKMTDPEAKLDICEVSTATGETCFCSVGGNFKCEIRKSTRFELINNPPVPNACEEVDSVIAVKVEESVCPLDQVTFTTYINGTAVGCVEPLVIDESVKDAWNYRNSEATGYFKAGLEDFHASIRFVYSTSTKSLSVCNVLGFGNRQLTWYENNREGDDTRIISYVVSAVNYPTEIGFEVNDAETADSFSTTSGFDLVSDNRWLAVCSLLH